MKEFKIDTRPIHRARLLVPLSDSRLKLESIEIFFGEITLKPENPIDAIVITADLQGVILKEKPSGKAVTETFSTLSPDDLNNMEKNGLIEIVPIGFVLPDILKSVLSEKGISPEQTLALLCGDLFGATKRGGSGDVSNIWQSFENTFGNVTGVLGNHDFLPANSGFNLLDGEIISFKELTIGGISGIIGNPKKPNRKAPETYRSLLTDILQKHPDILIIHESPRVTEASLPGRADISEWLKKNPNGTIVCTGHVSWKQIAANLPPHKIINVEQRVVILQNKRNKK